MAVLRMAINIINHIDREFRDVPKKFVMMSGVTPKKLDENLSTLN
jgi:hypothetical protein